MYRLYSLGSKMLKTQAIELLIILITKRSQPNKARWLYELILDVIRSTYSKLNSDVIPDLPVVERPPLPSSVLTSEALDDLPATGMSGYVICAV